MKTKPTIATTELKLISLDEFISKIAVRKTKESSYVSYNTLMGYTNIDENEVEANYRRRIVPLVNTKEELKISLVSQLMMRDRFLDNLQNIVEDIVVDSAVNYGTPTFMVSIGNRKWIAANPDDFNIYTCKDNRLAITCTAIGRNVINNILRIALPQSEK